ncbi:hypothetical protein ACFWJM_17860 [Streptomyces sp. NPDC127077]|uniref:hypothetical protein n=1 Tax=Streptomyces sp. NPDC127077 TaxID=3347131 RepID=UPI003664F46B
MLWVLITPLVAWVRHPAGLAVLLTATTSIVGVLSVTAWVFQVQHTPDELQGRANGTARFLASGANSLGALCGGYLLDRAGADRAGRVRCAAPGDDRGRVRAAHPGRTLGRPFVISGRTSL